MSLGTSGSSDGTDLVSQAVNRAAEAGIIPVIAAGNAGPNRYTIGAPGAAEQAITVGAMADVAKSGFSLAAFSSRGPTKDNRVKPDIAAPGVAITSVKANSTNQYIQFSGTSMATPFVAGTVALMLDANPELSVAEVKQILMETAQDWGPDGPDIDYGAGRLDVYAAVRRAGHFAKNTPPAVPVHRSFTGRIGASGASAEHTVNVIDTNYPLAATLLMPGWTSSSSPDFDLFVYNPDGSELGRSTGVTRQEQVAKMVPQTGTYRLVVKSYTGTGDYVLDVSAGLGAPVDLPPSVALEQPTEGATLAGAVTVKVRATDDVRIAKVELQIDTGAYREITTSFDGAYYTFAWETTGVTNGQHTLTARATDSAGQQATAARRVTIANPSTPPPGNQQQVTRTGRVTTSAPDATVEVTVQQRGYVDLALSWTTRSDLDLYVYAPDGRLVGRAYTLANPERFRVDTAQFGTGTYRIRVNLYSGTETAFTLTADGFKEEVYQGSLSPAGRDVTQTRLIGYSGRGRAVLSWTNSSDLDFYVYDPAGRERARAYTLYDPEQAEIPFDSLGLWSVRVNLYSGTGGGFTLQLYAPEAILR